MLWTDMRRSAGGVAWGMGGEGRDRPRNNGACRKVLAVFSVVVVFQVTTQFAFVCHSKKINVLVRCEHCDRGLHIAAHCARIEVSMKNIECIVVRRGRDLEGWASMLCHSLGREGTSPLSTLHLTSRRPGLAGVRWSLLDVQPR